jgi:hypothetical protein
VLRDTLVWEIVALPSRLLTPYMRELGGVWGQLELIATVLFGASALALLVLAWRARARSALTPMLRGLLAFVAVLFVTTTGFAVWTWDRVPLQYFTPLAWALPVCLAVCIERAWESRAARAFAWGLGAASLLMGLALVAGKSREDMRGAVAAARELGAEAQAASGKAPIYTALLAQPPHFENLLPYRAYAGDLAPMEPAELPQAGDDGFERPVIVLRRVVPLGRKEWLPITSGRVLKRELRIDRYLTAYWYAAE